MSKDYALPQIGRVSNKNIVKARGDSGSTRNRQVQHAPKFNYGQDPYSQHNIHIDKIDAIFRKSKHSMKLSEKRLSTDSS